MAAAGRYMVLAFNQGTAMPMRMDQSDGNWYYLNQDGRMQTSWLEDGGAKPAPGTSSGKDDRWLARG